MRNLWGGSWVGRARGGILGAVSSRSPVAPGLHRPIKMLPDAVSRFSRRTEGTFLDTPSAPHRTPRAGFARLKGEDAVRTRLHACGDRQLGHGHARRDAGHGRHGAAMQHWAAHGCASHSNNLRLNTPHLVFISIHWTSLNGWASGISRSREPAAAPGAHSTHGCRRVTAPPPSVTALSVTTLTPHTVASRCVQWARGMMLARGSRRRARLWRRPA